jgi:DNA-binding CsgD family transcriptional regulator
MRLRLALAALGAALGLYAIALRIWKPGALTLPAPVHVAIGWSFLAAGFVAWSRRPENRTGLLMMLTGDVWFGRDFDAWNLWLPTRLSELSQNLFLALLAHQLVVFPNGSPRSPRDRRLIAAAYTLAVPGYLVSKIDTLANDVLSGIAIVLALVILYTVVERWITATAPGRRALAPLIWTGPVVLVVVAISIANDYIGLSLSARADRGIHWAEIVYTAIPLAFLLGLLRTRLHRAAVGDLVLELSEVASPARVRDALRRALGDPSLEIAFALPNGYADADGRAVTLPADGGRAVTFLQDRSALIYDPSLLEDEQLVNAAGAAAQLALENARLQTELRVRPFPPQLGDALAELTPRELEVLALVAEGRTDRGIAQSLYVTPKTVEAHVRSIFRKLDLPAESTENRRVHAVLAFLRSTSRAGR